MAQPNAITLFIGAFVCWACGWALEWLGIYFRPRNRLLRWSLISSGCLIMALGLFSLAFDGWPWTGAWLRGVYVLFGV